MGLMVGNVTSGWIIAVAKIYVDSASIIYLLLLLFELESDSGLDFVSLISATNDCFERHSSMLCQGILWKSHHFLVSFFIFSLLFFSCGLDWLS
jgi:hypothetical protein